MAHASLATKEDLVESRMALKVKIAETKADIIKWVIGVGFSQTAMLVAVLRMHG